jgi:mannitol-1-phosphate 5-dehydrogenase
MPRALICGSGKIGRGFIAHLLSCSNYEIYFFDVSRQLVDALNTAGSYKVYLAGQQRVDCFQPPYG